MSEQVWERRECVSAEVDNSLVLLDLDTLIYHSLNKTAAAIWEALSTPKTVDEIVAILSDRYEVPAEACRVSVDRFLAKLTESNLVKPQEALATAGKDLPA